METCTNFKVLRVFYWSNNVNKNEELLPYYGKARDELKYNPETGDIFRYIKSRNRYKVVGTINGHGYRQIGMTINDRQKILYVHRIAWFVTYGELPNIIDHIDGNRINNKISNLRPCTHQENQFNRDKSNNNTSGFKGVSWDKRGKKWKSEIRNNGKKMYLGSFNCPKEASEVYEAKAKELHGEFYNGMNFNDAPTKSEV